MVIDVKFFGFLFLNMYVIIAMEENYERAAADFIYAGTNA